MPRTLTEEEFNAIKDSVLKAAPAGLSEPEFYRYIGPKFSEAIGVAENSAPTAEGSAVGRFLSGAGEMLNPVAAVKGIVNAAAHPYDTLSGMASQAGQQFGQAKDLYQQGRYVEAAGHAAAGAIPVIGPAAAAAGEQIAGGDIAGGLGKGAGMLAPVIGPKLLPKNIAVAPPMRTPNPAEAAAVEFGQSRGIPIDAGTATGNQFVRGAQAMADSSPLGSVVATRAKAAQAGALGRVGGELAADANPGGGYVSPEQAGQSITGGVRDLVGTMNDVANEAYGKLRKIEEDPKNARFVQTSPGTVEKVSLPVHIATAKKALEPLYNSLKREADLVPLMGDKGRALVALDRLMSAPDHAPLSVVDSALGDLKSMARTDIPELRTQGQGAAAMAVKALDQSVRAAAANAGPEALSALNEGRAATVAKYQAGDVLEQIKAEPVSAFRQMTAPQDSGIEFLRKVKEMAPDKIPDVGRAYLENLLNKATSEGGFKGAAGLQRDWQNLGPATKRELFAGPAHVQALDHFFLLAKRLEERVNPSGSATTASAFGHLGLMIANPITGGSTVIGSGALSKLLHSPRGVQALTRGLEVSMNPVSGATKGAALLNLTNAARAVGVDLSAAPAMAGPDDAGARQ